MFVRWTSSKRLPHARGLRTYKYRFIAHMAIFMWHSLAYVRLSLAHTAAVVAGCNRHVCM
jgi:hypothetical protein